MRTLFKLSCLAALLFGSMTIASAQYVVSAKAGLVNYVDRRVTVKHEDGGTERARVGLQLENGDIIDAQGRIEILLNPGATLRLEKGSLLKVVETKFSDMRFELDAGAAIVEATKDMGPKRGIELEIKTREASFSIEKYGLYEISASPAGSTVVMVHKGNGQVRTQGGQSVEVKGGHQLTITGSTIADAKIGKGSNDFQQWGQERAETLAALNSRIDIRDTLIGDRSGLYSGMWFYSGFWGSYVYMPFSNFYTSPYGYWYDACYDPYYWGNRNYGNGNGSGGGGTSTHPVKSVVGSNHGGSSTAGPIQHNPTGNRPTATSGRETHASNRGVSPGPTHASSTGGGGGAYRGGYDGGGSYGGGGGSSSGSSSSGTTRSEPSGGSSAPSSSPSRGTASPSSGGGGGGGSAKAGRGN